MPNEKTKIGVSVLSADFGHLADVVKQIENAGADALHLDIMDGHFVPNFSMGPQAVAAIRRSCSLFLDVHLMIYNPFDYIERFIAAGADQITFHFEATEDVEETLHFIRKCKKKAGLAFNPETSFSMVPSFLGSCDTILFMTVHPGFGGQKFLKNVLPKIRKAREMSRQLASSLDVQVDGGINEETAKQCIAAGANFLVSGHYLLNQPNLATAIQKLKGLA